MNRNGVEINENCGTPVSSTRITRNKLCRLNSLLSAKDVVKNDDTKPNSNKIQFDILNITFRTSENAVKQYRQQLWNLSGQCHILSIVICIY